VTRAPSAAPHDAPKYKGFILPLILTKRLCDDVYDDELNRIARSRHPT
jgi:hypothetical protein